MNDASSESEVPHPEDCDHRFELKGGAQSGGRAVTLWQCDICGLGRSQGLSSGVGDRDLNSGWNPKPDPEPDESEEKKGVNLGDLFG